MDSRSEAPQFGSALSGLSREIWALKYRYTGPDGHSPEADITDTWTRVAQALATAEPEPERALWTARFTEALSGFRFLPAGRILAGAGTGRTVTLCNCFVMGTIPDDLGGIFAHLRECALTLQQGGGIGIDFSPLRPQGSPVLSLGADASGPLSFMDVWDAMCRTMMSAGSRRGAMMATLACDHPDIEAFVEAKQAPERLRMFNLSVLVSDAFMQAVEEDRPWPLRFGGKIWRELPARGLWERIMRANHAGAEPGVIFIDHVNRSNNLAWLETISATNPCGEQPLPPYGACLLGSINLAPLVRRPFSPEAHLDLAALDELVPVAVRMLDNAVEVSGFPLPAQAAEARAKRRIGLGVTGLADALILCGVRYGSPRAVDLLRQWLGRVRRAAYGASMALAREKGPYPLWERERGLAGPMVAALDDELRAGIAAHGLRNGLITSIAPTGTISLLANNVSSGIEPVFAFSGRRAILQSDGTRRDEEVCDPAWQAYRRIFGENALLPEFFVDAHNLTPAEHLAMQAAAQEFIDSAISKTINCPESIPFQEFESIYLQAWRLGLKGCTLFRPNPITGSILTSGPAGAPQSVPETPPLSPPQPRPEILSGETYKVQWPDSDHAMYITLNDIIEDRHRRPFEIFINSKNMEHYAWTVALTRMISAVFRRGGDIAFVVEELKAVFDPRGGQWVSGRYVPSLLAAIGDVIERHMLATGFITAGPPNLTGPNLAGPDLSGPVKRAATITRQCPKCGQAGLLRQEGCDLCPGCGYSRCG